MTKKFVLPGYLAITVLLLSVIAIQAAYAQIPREIFIDVPVTGRIENAAQKHYYFIRGISGSGPLFVHLQKSRRADVGLSVYHNSLNNPPVKEVSEGNEILLMIDAPEPGTYYIVVRPHWPEQGLPVDYTLTVWVLPFNEVTGVVDLLDYQGDLTQIPVLIQIRNPGEARPIGQHEVFLDSSGRFYFVTSLEGIYDFAVKGSHWLRRVEPGVQITSYTMVNFALVNGDVDGDNEVTLFDFGALVAAFGSVPGDDNWNPDADLDGDEEVTLFDFGILVRNFGAIGDE